MSGGPIIIVPGPQPGPAPKPVPVQAVPQGASFTVSPPVSTSVADFLAFQISRERVRLTWQLLLPGWVEVRLTRQEDGGEEVLVGHVGHREQYIDEDAALGSLNRQIVYRLYIEGRDEPPAVAVLNATRMDPVAIKMSKNERILLKFRGFPAALFSIKTSGVRCSCFDEVRGMKKYDNCTLCKGGGFVNGYADPVVIYIKRRSPQQRNVNLSDAGKIEQSQAAFWTNTDFALRDRDILVTAANKRYRIEGAEQNSYNETPTMQTFRGLEIAPSDVEFDLELPDSIREELQKQPFKSTRN